LLVGLLQNITVSATAKATGISEATIYKYLNDEEFCQEYEAKRRELLNDSCHTLQANMHMAVGELVSIIQDKSNKAQIRLNAIDMLLRHAYKQTELSDILDRLSALEELNTRE
jgi:hypothetical protein